jgi:predicted acyltransferase
MPSETYALKSPAVAPPLAGKPSPPTKPAQTVPPREAELRAAAAAPRPGPVGRLVSLDAYRGFIMILLAASGFGVARFAALPEEAEVWHRPVVEGGQAREATAADVEARREGWRLAAFHFDHPTWRSDFLPFLAKDSTKHPAWQRVGVSFWDLIQPAFMFMVGAAMPFSFRRRRELGDPLPLRILHAFLRAVMLVLLGVFLYSMNAERTNWIFPNVLAQIGLGYFFVYLLSGLRSWLQVLCIAGILGGYWWFMQFGYWQMTGTPRPDGTYDYAAVNADPAKGEVLSGAFAPWSKNDNAAHYVDVQLLNMLRDPHGEAMEAWRSKMQKEELSWSEWVRMSVRRIFFAETEPFEFNSGGYQTLNFIPSMATMLLGALCGRLLLANGSRFRKLLTLLLLGALCLAIGRVMGMYTDPIVKRIWTPSWAMFSGAFVIWMLAAFYFLFDILPLRWLAFPLVVVGMNSIVMYMLGQLMRPFAREHIVSTHLTGLLQTVLGTDPVVDGELYLLRDEMFGRLIDPIAVLLVFWLIAFWLWRRGLFVRI